MNNLSHRNMRKMRRAANELNANEPAYKRDSDFRFIIYIVAVIMLAFSIRLFIFEPFRVDGDSMYDTLLDGERMFVNKTAYWFSEPERGDIVTCYYPGYTVSCVKRVIGLPGETIEMRSGNVYINGIKLDESEYLDGFFMSAENMDPVTIPSDSIFVIGDNRNNSKDSRFPSVGPIPLYRVIGHCTAVIWPIARIRGI